MARGHQAGPKISDTGLTVLSMMEPPAGYDVTITVDRDGGYPPNPAEFAVAAEQDYQGTGRRPGPAT